MGDSKPLSQPKLSNADDKSALSNAHLDKVTGGTSLSYEKVEIVYKPQQADGAANKAGDPDAGGQIRLK